MSQKLMDVVRESLRVKQYAYKTEQTYMQWIRKYTRFHLPKHPRDVGVDSLREWLVKLDVSAATPASVNCAPSNQSLLRSASCSLVRK